MASVTLLVGSLNLLIWFNLGMILIRGFIPISGFIKLLLNLILWLLMLGCSILNDVLNAILDILGRIDRIENLYFLNFTHLVINVSLLRIHNIVLLLLAKAVCLRELLRLSWEVHLRVCLLAWLLIHLMVDRIDLVGLRINSLAHSLVVLHHVTKISLEVHVLTSIEAHHVLLLRSIKHIANLIT